MITKTRAPANNPVTLKLTRKFQQKPAKIFISACPAIIFAKSRIERLKTRAKYDTNSTTINKGLINIGLLAGRNKFKNSIPLLRIPKILTPMKNDNATKKVILR